MRPSMPSSNAANTIAAERQFELVLDRQADRGQPRAQRQQRDQIGQQRAHRNRLEAARGTAAESGRTAERPWAQYSRVRRARHGARKRFSQVSLTNLPAAECPPSVAGTQVGKHGFAGNRGLADRHQRRRTLRADRRRAASRSGSCRSARRRRWSGPRARSRRCAAPPGRRSAPRRCARRRSRSPAQLRSLSSLALSRSALKNLPGR